MKTKEAIEVVEDFVNSFYSSLKHPLKEALIHIVKVVKEDERY